jgi:hypothetical protein
MRKRTPELADLYKALAKQTVSVARDRRSITQDMARELLDLVNAECGMPNAE